MWRGGFPKLLTRMECLNIAFVTVQDLIDAGFPMVVVIAVNVLTKIPGEDYFKYLERVKQNIITRKVKPFDMLSNFSDSPTKRQVKKYADGLSFLLREII